MAVKHVLKNGKRVKNISGHVIKQNEFKALYGVINAINERGK